MTFPSSQVYDWDMYNIKKDILKKQKSIRDKKGGRLRSASFKMRCAGAPSNVFGKYAFKII